MPKKTIALIVILALATIGLVYLALKSSDNPQSQTATPSPTQPVVKTAKLYFEPNSVSASTSSRTPAQAIVMIDSGGSEISGAQVELQYDPSMLTNVEFIPASSSAFFNYPAQASILTNTVNQTEGMVSFVISIAPNTSPLKGAGVLGTLKFIPVATTPTSLSQIVFTPDSAVTSLTSQESILKEATPLQISIQRAQQTTPRTSSPSATTQ